LNLRPAVLRIHTDDAVGWLNYSRQRAVVSFDDEVAKKLTCQSRNSFRLTGRRLTTSPIQSQQFASLCTLAPGEYDYEVQLMSGAGAGAAAGRTLKARIVVE
jgi:hypothetical protein